MKYQNIFNQDFYPTPREVLDLMELDVNNKIILEPSAGKGNIIDYLKEYGAKEVLFCEINKDLAEICKTKANQIGTDFLELKPEAVAGVEAIIVNS
ncbi:DNA methyltransferase [Riemerella phage vB_RanS_GDF21]|uniref:Class I SAM-dependent methyltransferase n=1 Tax=Riemerella anatipestifer TaxID=34085 RepID=A0AAP6LJP1_RIEAN|nr:class I SAM-dependent methyltransferase [Riemerella anatipestifer]